MSVQDVIGPGDLLLKDQIVSLESVVGGKDFVLLYFSAMWCAPCKLFSPQLAKHYAAWNLSGKKVAIIYISGDMNATAFGKYYGTMPWHALPFGDARKTNLEQKCQVTGLPWLTVLDATGAIVREDAVNEVKANGEDVLNSWK